MSVRRYAEDTKVPAMQSRREIEELLQKHGADQFLSGTMRGQAMVGFRIQGLQVKIVLGMPTGTTAKDAKEERRRWRALLLVIKAKLEAVASGIALLEDEFLAHTVMADGQTVGQWARPQIKSMYKDGKMPPLLPGPKP
ncbi:hypothetical protein [Hyphomicrobium sp. 802]|uniref:hypothetical protein n=1 Tax=Hyphomicrobium sp. 802 TaxID=1112272 RepID=UPI00045E5E11|nr:hypothetical protein [Hyphomicrobium sp. 802]